LVAYGGTRSYTNQKLVRFNAWKDSYIKIKEGKPEYLFVATGINDKEGFGSCSHVLKVKIKE